LPPLLFVVVLEADGVELALDALCVASTLLTLARLAREPVHFFSILFTTNLLD
jgi:hypothetical protein